MKKLLIAFVILLIIILVVRFATPEKTIILETKESNEGPISVKVTPKDLNEELLSWDFEIALDTHSEELSVDLVTVSELMDEQAKPYKPIAWEGDPPGGHHRSGVLKFKPISSLPKSLELRIKNVGGISERSFKWNL